MQVVYIGVYYDSLFEFFIEFDGFYVVGFLEVVEDEYFLIVLVSVVGQELYQGFFFLFVIGSWSSWFIVRVVQKQYKKYLICI